MDVLICSLCVGVLQWSALDIAGGWLGWGMLLVTTVTTARWLEGVDALVQRRWEMLRLACVALCLVYAYNVGAASFLLGLGVLYLVVNIAVLALLVRPRVDFAAPVTHQG